MKKSLQKIVAFAAFSLVFTIAYGNGKGPVTPAMIMGWTSLPGNIMRMVVNAPDAAENYYPKATTNLTDGVWSNVAHSATAAGPFAVTNLSVSTAEGTNEVIYVQADEPAKFFGIGGQ